MCNAEGGSCNASGSCVCKDGWSGVNCDVAVCSPECVTGNGQCVALNNCSCDPGWTGNQCETCIPADGCCKSFSIHQYCLYHGTPPLQRYRLGYIQLSKRIPWQLHVDIAITTCCHGKWPGIGCPPGWGKQNFSWYKTVIV